MNEDIENRAEELVERNITSLLEQKETDDELKRSDIVHLSKHNEEFSGLLSAYVENYNKTGKQRIFARKIVFYVSLGIMIVVPLVTVGVVAWAAYYACIKESATVVIPAMVGAVVSLIGTLMTIPQIIANYLYNADEELYLSEIIGKIQEYDSHIRGMK